VEVKEIEVEVLPPGQKGKAEGQELARILAWVLDDLIPIPGTKYRVGLDPIIGLIPGLGDTSASAIGTILLLQAFRQGVSKVVIARMAANILINSVIGVIPGVGDFFSAAFKSNRRNFELLQRHATGSRRATTGDWVFLIALLSLVLAGVLGVAFLSAFLIMRLFQFLFS
jgi:hypothetical protein